MLSPIVEIDDELPSFVAFASHQQLRVLNDHLHAKETNTSPRTFVTTVLKAAEQHRAAFKRKPPAFNPDYKSKIADAVKYRLHPIANIFLVTAPQLQQSELLPYEKYFTADAELKKRPQQKQKKHTESLKKANAIYASIVKAESANDGSDVTCIPEVEPIDDQLEVLETSEQVPVSTSELNEKELRNSKRTRNTPKYAPLSPVRKRHRKMSKHDYNFATQTDVVPIGGKAMPGRGYHTNAIDTNYGADSVYRQQLQEMATSMGSLCNIGNSCYMNSVIYTLRYTPLFLHNLHHLVSDFAHIYNQKENQQKLKSASLGRTVNGLQGPNARSYSSKDLVSLGSSSSSTVSLPTLDIVKTTQQKAAEKLHELFQCLSNNENAETTEPYQSDIFLKAIQDVNPIFEGNQQQDAHEFLMCILDSIRETCQALKKNVIEHPEIIMQGYCSAVDQVDRQIVNPTPPPPQPTVEKKKWFPKRRKEEKTKNLRVDSPSKESRAHSESATTSNAASSAVAGAAIMNGATGCDVSPTSAESVLDKIRELGIEFFSEDFEGICKASTLCLTCETTTEQDENMLDLSVPITENMDELDESFIEKLCITRERFQGDNKFRCETCTGYTEAVRQISYPKLPRLLVIQLKRFSGGMEKINSYIPTPFTLKCFCAECHLKSDGPKDHEYKLYSVITHVGATMCAGHYIAYTCSLNLNSCYQNCPKEAYKSAQAAAAVAAAAAAAASANAIAAANAGKDGKSSGASSGSSNPVTGVVKKLAGLGRNKNSNADATKNQKNCNGVKAITNGVDGIQLGNNASTSPTTAIGGVATTVGVTATPCPSMNCCSIKMKSMPKAVHATTLNGTNGGGGGVVMSNGDYSHHSRNGSLSSVYSEHDQFGQVNGVNRANAVGAGAEPIWFMCDDDKIKAMPQYEFSEMLSPNKKNMITPYLLFYARCDVHQPSH